MSDIENLLPLAKMLLPGHGFFGDLPITALRVPVNGRADVIHFELADTKPTYLNLAGLRLVGPSGSAHRLADIMSSATLSSGYSAPGPQDVAERLTAGNTLHSGEEKRPRLTVELHKPVALSHIEVLNRAAPHGKRSRNLVVSVWNGTTEMARHINSGDGARVDMLEALAERAGVDLTDAGGSENRRMILASELKCELARRVDAGEIELSLAECYSLLPLYEIDPLVNTPALVFCGVALSHMLARQAKIQTGHLQFLKAVLSSPARIERALETAQKHIRRTKGGDLEIFAAKHNLLLQGLLADKDQYLAVMHVVVDQMRNWGFETVLCYGTLLGAVRDKGFIPHDDDVDMLYFDGSTDREDMMARRESVLEQFRSAGYRIWDSGTNFHVTPPGYSVGIDLFPCYTAGNNTALMMQRYHYREIPTRLLKPVGSIEFYGETYPAPAEPEAFLAERYGSGWSVSDPFHEWPWELNTTDSWPKRKTTRGLSANRALMVAWGQHLGPGAHTPVKNSLALAAEAVSQGFDAVELDVRQSSDGVFVLGHDDLITGADGSQIVISETDARTLRGFDLGGNFEGGNTIRPLADATKLLGNTLLHLDPRVPPEKYAELRRTIDKAGYDPAKIIFCGYGYPALRELITHFPESVLLNKYYAHFSTIDEFVMDELKARQIDGLMLYWPLHYEDASDFVAKLKARDLQVLFYCHGGWPGRGEKDDSDASLAKMVAAGVDYVTTTASNTKTFARLTRKGY